MDRPILVTKASKEDPGALWKGILCPEDLLSIRPALQLDHRRPAGDFDEACAFGWAQVGSLRVIPCSSPHWNIGLLESTFKAVRCGRAS